MPLSPDGRVVTLYGDAGDPGVDEAVELLDRSGLAYRWQPSGAASSDPSTQVRMRCGDASLQSLSRDQVLEFLRTHGAQFEDS